MITAIVVETVTLKWEVWICRTIEVQPSPPPAPPFHSKPPFPQTHIGWCARLMALNLMYSPSLMFVWL